MRRRLPVLALAVAYLWFDAAAFAAEPQQAAGPPVAREIIPGSTLMTHEERERYRQRMRAAQSPDAQAGVRGKHVEQMQERARVRGLRLADPPTAREAK